MLYRSKHEAQRGVVAPLQGISDLRRAHYSTETLDSALVEKVMGWCKVDLEDATNVPQGLFDYAIVLHGSHNAALPAIGPPRKKPNRLLEHATTAVGPRERKPRRKKLTPVPSLGAE